MCNLSVFGLVRGKFPELFAHSVCGEKEEENLTNLQKYKAVNERDIRYIYKEIGGESGVTVGFKTKSLKAVTVKREILPRKIITPLKMLRPLHEHTCHARRVSLRLRASINSVVALM